MHLVASVRLSVCPCVDLFFCALLLEPLDLGPSYLVLGLTLTSARLGLYIKVIGQRSRSNAKNRVLHPFHVQLWQPDNDQSRDQSSVDSNR